MIRKLDKIGFIHFIEAEEYENPFTKEVQFKQACVEVPKPLNGLLYLIIKFSIDKQGMQNYKYLTERGYIK